jgi:hypothetical protein
LYHNILFFASFDYHISQHKLVLSFEDPWGLTVGEQYSLLVPTIDVENGPTERWEVKLLKTYEITHEHNLIMECTLLLQMRQAGRFLGTEDGR